MFPAVSLDRTHTDDNTDTLTQATVQKMCALIRDSATDPLVQRCAAYARNHFSCGSSDQAALAWGVFWYVKHCVKFRSDEGTTMQVGEQALDLLTAPAVLVRMKDPGEDCDGFTMLSAAMLTILGVPVLVTTVATDLDDPRRWSHVFLCAIVNGRVMPLDTSHGKAPGWMVPRDRINRFQTWTLDGRPADVKIPNYQGLHGYVNFNGMGQVRDRRTMRPPVIMFPRRAGMGQTCMDEQCDVDGANCTCYDNIPGSPPATAPAATDTPQLACLSSGGGWNGTGCVMPYTGGALNTPLTPAQAGLTPAQEAALIAATGNSAVSLIRTATGGPYTVAGTNLVYNPATGQLTTAAAVNATALGMNLSSITSNMPLILGALAAILILPSLVKK